MWGPCKFLKRSHQKIKEELREKEFVFMDIDKFPEIAEMLDICHILKTFLIYNRKLIDSFVL